MGLQASNVWKFSRSQNEEEWVEIRYTTKNYDWYSTPPFPSYSDSGFVVQMIQLATHFNKYN